MSNMVPARPSGAEEWKKSSSDRVTANKIESWKMSGKPRHAQLQHVAQEEDPRNRRQSAPLFNSPYHHPKPLPQEPSPAIQHNVYPPSVMGEPFTQAPFHLTTPIQQHHRPAYTHNEVYPPITPYMPANEFVPPPLVDYQQYHHQPEYPPQQQPLYNEFPPQDYHHQPEYLPQQQQHPIIDYSPQHHHHPIGEYPPQQQQHPIGEYPPQPPYKEFPLQDYPSQQPIVPEHSAPVTKPEGKPQKKKDAKPESKEPLPIFFYIL